MDRTLAQLEAAFDELERENDEQKRLNLALAERCAAQSELLTKAAGKPKPPAESPGLIVAVAIGFVIAVLTFAGFLLTLIAPRP